MLAVVACQSHKLKVGGANPSSAPKSISLIIKHKSAPFNCGAFVMPICRNGGGSNGYRKEKVNEKNGSNTRG